MKFKKRELILEERIKQTIPIPNEVMQLYKLFVSNGYELYVVGGAIRDFLLKKPIKDYDLATNATPQQMVEMLDANNIKNVPVEVNGTQAVVNVHMKDDYEIATFREESKESDGRRPDSIKFANIETDVLRRDLTINALFYDISKKEIVDLVGGLEDIKNGVVRTVGAPEERFTEDKLRILRAIRFAARVGSKLDPAIDKALRGNSSLQGISGERIRDEFLKGIQSAKSVKYFLTLLEKYNLFEWILKGIKPINKNFIESNDTILVLTMLVVNVDYTKIRKLLNNINYTNDEIKQVYFLLKFYNTFDKDTFRELKILHDNSGLSDDTFLIFADLVNIDIALVKKFINYVLSVNGDEVKAKYGLTDGPQLGQKIKDLEYQQFMNN